MAQTYKILGQVALAAADTEEELFSVRQSYECVVSSITICNRTAAWRTFRISLDQFDDNAADADDQDYLYFDRRVAPNDTFIATVGLTLGPNDALNVFGSHADMTFQAFGREIPIKV